MPARPWLTLASSSALPFFSAMPYCSARERRVGHGLELGAGVVGDVVDHHAVVGDDGIDAARLQLLQRQRRRLEALDRGAGLAEQLGHRFVAGGAGLHADLELLQVVELGDLAAVLHRDQLHRVEVRVVLKSIVCLRSSVIVTAETTMSRSPWPRALKMPSHGRVDELDLDAGLGGDGFDDVDVEADDLALFVLRLERRIGGVGADDIDLGGCGRCRGRCRGGRRRGGRGFLLAAGGEQQAGGQEAGGLQELAGRRAHAAVLAVLESRKVYAAGWSLPCSRASSSALKPAQRRAARLNGGRGRGAWWRCASAT